MRIAKALLSLTHPLGAAAIACLMGATAVCAQPQSRQQVACITSMNKIGVRLAAAQGKANVTCIANAVKGKLGASTTAGECLTADSTGKIAKLAIRLHTTQQQQCAGTKPSFGYTNAATITAAVPAESLLLVEEIFDAPLDTAMAVGLAAPVVGKCQQAVARAYERFVAARLKQFNACKRDGLKMESITDAAALEACIIADPGGNVAKVRSRILDSLSADCQGVDLAAAFPGVCRAQQASMVAFADCVSSRADCHSCVAINGMDGLLHSCDLQDDGIVNASCRSCGNGFVEAPEVCDTEGASAACDSDCTAVQCGDGSLNGIAGEQCDDGNPVSGDGCDSNCLPTACGNGVSAAGEECDDGNASSGDGCSNVCACELGSTVSGCPDPQCPTTVELTAHAGVGDACAQNSDCAAGTCDGLIGRCRTQTTDDIGYSGIVHDVDTNDGVVTTLELACEGPAPVCGQCSVRGIDPASGNCRCANDRTSICDQPFLADADDCGGATCECFEGPPQPASQGGFPVCLVWKHRSDVAGTVNVDSGAMALDEDLRTLVYLGEATLAPCPYCSADPVAADGIRDGTCVFGPNAGGACDAGAINRTFPAPAGDGHSLDCMPSEARNISNEGVVLHSNFVTDTIALASTVACGLPSAPQLCPCGVCSSAPTVGCASDSDCVGLGSCEAVADGVPKPNECSDGVCVDVGGQEGVCANGPSQRYCDGLVRANGEPFLSCVSNADCAAGECGSGGCGNCSLTLARECFLDPIVAVGQADPLAPRLVATPCMPQVNPGLNQINGLPGAGRQIRQMTARYRCPLGSGVEYVAGVGGCP